MGSGSTVAPVRGPDQELGITSPVCNEGNDEGTEKE